MNRRHFLRATCAGLGVGAGFATNLASLNAFAAEFSDYKALVCVFLYGGNDGHDTIIPYDLSSNREFSRIRQPLLAEYSKGLSRQRDRLLPLSGDIGGRKFAFPPELKRLHSIYESGEAAIVGNIGPLVEMVSRQSFESGAARLPAKLFSHNDQQSTWMASHPEGADTGWGGRFADVMHAAQANTTAGFSAISVSGNSSFLTGQTVRSFVTSASGAYRLIGADSNSAISDMYQKALRGADGSRDHVFERDIASIANASLNSGSKFNEQLELPGDPMTSFPTSPLAEQLHLVSRTIARRSSLGMKRQIFFVSQSGYDSHSRQGTKLPKLQAELDAALGSFYDALVEMGVENSVTTFTASDFGRTLGVNGDGTDHGWGGHHIVIGGAVRGAQILGNIPEPGFGHNLDAGRGRLIPDLSVDQYAASFGRWFGLTDGELTEVIPGLTQFDREALSDLFR